MLLCNCFQSSSQLQNLAVIQLTWLLMCSVFGQAFSCKTCVSSSHPPDIFANSHVFLIKHSAAEVCVITSHLADMNADLQVFPIKRSAAGTVSLAVIQLTQGPHMQVFLLKRSAAGIGPYNRKWRGYPEKATE